MFILEKQNRRFRYLVQRAYTIEFLKYAAAKAALTRYTKKYADHDYTQV